MNTCPHCKATPCLALWRKIYLGPTGTAHCQVCGYRVGLDVGKATLSLGLFFLLLIVLFPVLLLTAAWDLLPNIVMLPIMMVVLLALSLATTLTLFAVWVPLRVDELTNASMVEEGRARIAACKQSRNVK